MGYRMWGAMLEAYRKLKTKPKTVWDVALWLSISVSQNTIMFCSIICYKEIRGSWCLVQYLGKICRACYQ